jgi:hypothetical protein
VIQDDLGGQIPKIEDGRGRVPGRPHVDRVDVATQARGRS